jgi:hypothetical protein
MIRNIVVHIAVRVLENRKLDMYLKPEVKDCIQKYCREPSSKMTSLMMKS